LHEAEGAQPLIERLASEDRATQRLACDEAAEKLGEDAGLRRELGRLLDGDSPRGRFAAAYVLFRSGHANLRLLPALLAALELEDGDLRWGAAHMLATLGRMQGEVLPVVLHEARESQSALRRRMAVYVLRELGPDRDETRAALLASIEDPDPEVRRASLSSLGKLLDPDAACAERVLAILDRDPDPRMRRIAAVVLPDLVAHRPEASAAARKALATSSRTDDPGLARAARASLARIEEASGSA
jgi:HEAT repeat protein